MCAEWIRDFNPSIVIHELNAARKQDREKISYDGFRVHALKTTLLSMLRFSDLLPSSERMPAIGRALFAKYPGGTLSPDAFLKEISHHEREYVGREKQSFCLISQLLIRGDMPFDRIKFFGSTIALKFKISKFDRSKFEYYGKHHVYGALPRVYQPVLVSVESPSSGAAGDSALDALDAVRGMLNLPLNFNKGLRISSGRRKPINDIRLGPLHSLHDAKGKFLPDRFWFDPYYVGEGDLFDITKHRDNLQKSIKYSISRLKKSMLREDALRGLVLYVRALDHWNYRSCFIALWGILEFLTNTQNANYSDTVRRAASLYRDTEITVQILEHLRKRRNDLLHKSEEYEDEEVLIFQLKRFVEQLLLFYLRNEFDLRSREQVSQFLSLPKEREILDQRVKMLRSMQKYRYGRVSQSRSEPKTNS